MAAGENLKMLHLRDHYYLFFLVYNFQYSLNHRFQKRSCFWSFWRTVKCSNSFEYTILHFSFYFSSEYSISISILDFCGATKYFSLYGANCVSVDECSMFNVYVSECLRFQFNFLLVFHHFLCWFVKSLNFCNVIFVERYFFVVVCVSKSFLFSLFFISYYIFYRYRLIFRCISFVIQFSSHVFHSFVLFCSVRFEFYGTWFRWIWLKSFQSDIYNCVFFSSVCVGWMCFDWFSDFGCL